jgi:hypothetical protein
MVEQLLRETTGSGRRQYAQPPPGEIHTKLDGVLCKGCLRCVSKYMNACSAIIDIKKRLSEIFCKPVEEELLSAGDVSVSPTTNILGACTPRDILHDVSPPVYVSSTPVKRQLLLDDDDDATIESHVGKKRRLLGESPYIEACKRAKNKKPLESPRVAVFNRLQKVDLALSYLSTLRVMDIVSEGFDESIDNWKRALSERVRIYPSHEDLFFFKYASTISSISSPQYCLVTQNDIESTDHQITSRSDSDSAPAASDDETSAFMPSVPILSFPSFTNQQQNNHTWSGFILATDNLDRNIKPRHQTIASKTISMHWSNTIAVKDRCDFSNFEDDHDILPSIDPLSQLDIESLFLPNKEDDENIINNFAVITGRILIKYVPSFAKFSSLSTKHIEHKYSREMSLKSQVVSFDFVYNEKKFFSLS